MPVSKKRKKKGQKPAGPPPKGGFVSKPKVTKQQILLYIISAVMIISLAASFLVGSGRHTGVSADQATPQAVDGNNLLTDPPASNTQESGGDGAEGEDDADANGNGSEDGATDSE